jgi:hypothetical protein
MGLASPRKNSTLSKARQPGSHGPKTGINAIEEEEKKKIPSKHCYLRTTVY